MIAARSGCPQRGFTLVELVIVIVVMAILSFGTVQFILNSSEAYSDAGRRDRLGSSGRIAIEKMAREVRNALPNSARVGELGGDYCLEFIPVLAGSDYVSVPVMSASSGFPSVPFATAPVVGRAAVYPIDGSSIYTVGVVPAVISPTLSTASAALVSTGVVSVSFDSAHQFPADSPENRWFMVDQPVSYCLVGELLFRYQNYGYSTAQRFPGSAGALALPSAVTGASGQRYLLASQASAEDAVNGPFRVDPATLQRNALVRFDLSFLEQGEGIRISHEVQLRNVP